MASLLEQELSTEQSLVHDSKLEEITSNFEPLDGEEIAYSDTPSQDRWSLHPIRKESQTGGTLIWQIGFDPDKNHLIRRKGFELTPTGEPGTINDDTVVITENQSGRSIQEQALLQAKKMFLDKTREGYSAGGISSEHLLPAQLACQYRPPNVVGKKKSNEREIKLSDFKYTVFVQPKLDGLRCRSTKSGTNIEMITRTNCEINWHDHIRAELNIFFLYLPEGSGLDGELMGSGVFEDTSSKIRQKHKKHEDNEDIKYYIFDLIIPETKLEDRVMILSDAYQKYSRENKNQHFFVLRHSYARTHEDIDELLRQSLERKYEGLILRFPAGQNPTKRELERSWYKGGRNTNLLTYKLFQDEEGIVLDIVEAKDKFKGQAVLVLRDPRRNTFNCVAHGDEPLRREIYDNREKHMGKKYTYKYFELTKYGIPRFPVGLRFRDYE